MHISQILDNQSRALGLVAIALLMLGNQVTGMALDPLEAAKELGDAQKMLGKPIFKMAEKLMNNLSEGPKKNIVISPLSLHSAMSMLVMGAKPGSETERELMEFLFYKNMTNSAKEAHEAYGKIMMKFKDITKMSEEQGAKLGADTLTWSPRDPVLDFWTMAVAEKSNPLKGPFKDNLKKNYMTEMKQIADPKEASAIVEQVNAWGKKAGFGKPLLEEKDLKVGGEEINLMTAVRVQGWWTANFFERKAEPGMTAFMNQGDPKNEKKDHMIISASNVNARYAIFSKDPKNKCLIDGHMKLPMEGEHKPIDPALLESLNNLEFHSMEIPMKGNMTITLIEPLKDGIEELVKLEKSLIGETNWRKVFHQLRTANVNEISMPKFSMENSIDLPDAMSKSGLTKTLSSNAEFTEIADKKMIIKKVNQKAFMEMDKNGIRGGAMTRIAMIPLSLRVDQCPIRINLRHPFLFIVRYGRLTLFMGRVVEL